MILDVNQLPQVAPKERPKRLPLASILSSEEEEHVRGLGWEPLDVRLMSNNDMNDRKEAVLAWLEGHRLGTITLTKIQLDAIELEMRACGLLSNKIEAVKAPTKLKKSDVDEIFEGVKSARAFLGTQAAKKS